MARTAPLADNELRLLSAIADMTAAGLQLHPAPVDASGLDVAYAQALLPAPRLIYVTPSHQYPGGAVMPLARRQALLACAEAHGAWIIEDDYDSEFRYASQPVAALQGLADSARVIYLGTLSKVMCPALRLAYLVAPDASWRARGITRRRRRWRISSAAASWRGISAACASCTKAVSRRCARR